MTRRSTLLSVIMCLVTAATTFALVRSHYYEAGEEGAFRTETVRSSVLAEDRQTLVYLPESYTRDSSKRYPVMYVLDGGSHAGHTAQSARVLARIGVIPEMIIVGIPSRSENRNRDYTPPSLRVSLDEDDAPPGRADRFLAFLERELIPHIDRSFRTVDSRILAGNSRGGLFVVYSLMERPDLFDAHFAFSPALWREDDRIVSQLAEAFEEDVTPSTFLYTSLGDAENAKMRRAWDRTAGLLQSAAWPALQWHAEIRAGATHDTNAVLSTPVALHEYYRSRAGEVPR